MPAEKMSLAPWIKELFFEENRSLSRRPFRAVSLIRKLLSVAPHLFSFVFCNFSAAYPDVSRELHPAPRPVDPIALTLDEWPTHPTRGEERGLPLADSSVSSLDLGNSLTGVRDLVFVLREVHRVLLPGARVTIATGDRRLSDPTAVRAITQETIAFFTPALSDPALRLKAERLDVADLFDVVESSSGSVVLEARKPKAPVRPRAIDIGSGSAPRDGYHGIDFIAMPGVAIVRDVERHGLPFADSTIERVNSAHFLEHVADLVFVMNEIHRVCCHDALVDISVPSLLGPYAAADPTHRRLFNARTFSYFESGDPAYAGIEKGFEILQQKVGFSISTRMRVIKPETAALSASRADRDIHV